jgi:hypothetical protein
MRISRRQFACGLAGFACLAPAAAARGHIERRAYAPGSVLPPTAILRRYGIHPASVKQQQNGTVYLMAFSSLEARVKAWDQFNADEEWCMLRDAGVVALREIQVYPAGKIFEISL